MAALPLCKQSAAQVSLTRGWVSIPIRAPCLVVPACWWAGPLHPLSTHHLPPRPWRRWLLRLASPAPARHGRCGCCRAAQAAGGVGGKVRPAPQLESHVRKRRRCAAGVLLGCRRCWCLGGGALLGFCTASRQLGHTPLRVLCSKKGLAGEQWLAESTGWWQRRARGGLYSLEVPASASCSPECTLSPPLCGKCRYDSTS